MTKTPRTKIASAVRSIFARTSAVSASQASGTSGVASQTRSAAEAPSSKTSNPVLGPSEHDAETATDWNLAEIKMRVSEFCEQGRLSRDLIDLICKNGRCAPIEFDCLDYKETVEGSSYDKAKLVKRVVSFYNTFGGYLIFGVQERDTDTNFNVVGMDASNLDVESLKSSIKDLTGVRILLSLLNVDVATPTGEQASVTILHIPKRLEDLPPVHFVKDGPSGQADKKLLFRKGEIYCRDGDECREAIGPRILELNKTRPNPHLKTGGGALVSRFRVDRIANNLPDRNSICPKFIGRDETIASLWRWLTDDLSHVKVLAGEGGLGKSSLAFEFAERLSESKDAPFEQIIWLSAKERQFDAFEDKYGPARERQYRSYEELLIAVCKWLSCTDEELDGATPNELKRMFKKGLTLVSYLIVIDDVDSLPPEEQKQVLELGMIMLSGASRLLLTTRANQSYSLDTVIKVSGFDLEFEYPAYLQSLCTRLGLLTPKKHDIEKIHLASGGNPLYTESIMRLLRAGTNLGEALAAWKNDRGSNVRAAALRREVESLSQEAKRILVTIAMLKEVSNVELCEALGYTAETVESGVTELQALFLVDAPSLASIPRISVPENTRRLVLDPTLKLVTDPVRLEKDIATFREKGSRKPTKDSRVAAAISQAESLWRVGQLEEARSTITEARQRTNDHYDLLCYQATLCMKDTPQKIDEARHLCRLAFHAGCRKLELFFCWFESEWRAEHYIGALEAAESAIATDPPQLFNWQHKQALALAFKSVDQSKSGSVDSAVSVMTEASQVIRRAIASAPRVGMPEWEAEQAQFHDQIWVWAGNAENGLARAQFQVDALESMWKYGDKRITNQKRALSAIESMIKSAERKLSGMTIPQRNLFSVLFEKGHQLFRARQALFANDERHKAIEMQWNAYQVRAAQILDT